MEGKPQPVVVGASVYEAVTNIETPDRYFTAGEQMVVAASEQEALDPLLVQQYIRKVVAPIYDC